jgi:hypothetical protein
MSAAGGGDRTTLHNAARHSAAVALQAQLATRFGPAAAVAGLKEEVSVDGASGSSPGKKPGRADILFRSGNTAYIWEVKSAGTGLLMPSPLQAARIAQAAGQVQRYLRYYRIKNPPPLVAGAGPPMAAPVGVFGFPAYQVWSPVQNPVGAILYQQVQKPPKVPVPPPIPVKAPQRRTQPRQVRNPVTGPPPILTPAPLPLPSAREVVEGVLVVAVAVVVVVAFASGVGEAAAGLAAIGAGIASLF